MISQDRQFFNVWLQAQQEVSIPFKLRVRSAVPVQPSSRPGTHLPYFTGTKVQILTQVRRRRPDDTVYRNARDGSRGAAEAEY